MSKDHPGQIQGGGEAMNFRSIGNCRQAPSLSTHTETAGWTSELVQGPGCRAIEALHSRLTGCVHWKLAVGGLPVRLQGALTRLRFEAAIQPHAGHPSDVGTNTQQRYPVALPMRNARFLQ